MAYIITSKTRSKIRSQPREYAKLLGDLRQNTMDKHRVHSISPVAGQTEDEVHKELDDQGSFVKEAMEQNREKNLQLSKAKQKAREPMRQKVVKERIAALKARDEKSGLADLARQQLANAGASKKKRRK